MEQNHQDITAKNKQPIKGTLIYQPKGPAGEYTKWAINLYNGCSNGCEYCYNRRGVLSTVFDSMPTPKAVLINKTNAARDKFVLAHVKDENPDKGDLPGNLFGELLFDTIVKCIYRDIEKIGCERLINDGGVFMSFTCDPLDDKENVQDYTLLAVKMLLREGIPVTLLTKKVDWVKNDKWHIFLKHYPRYYPTDNFLAKLIIGFTLTGMDEMEVNAPSSEQRIACLRNLHEEGFETFVSLEPVIDITRAMDVLDKIITFTDEVRVGVQSPLKQGRYDDTQLRDFVERLYVYYQQHDDYGSAKITIKDSLVRQAMMMQDYGKKLSALYHLSWMRDCKAIIAKDESLYRIIYKQTK